MSTRLGGRVVVVGLLLLIPAGAASAVTAAPTATVAEDTAVKPFGWKGRESMLTVEDKVVFFVAGAISADAKGCVLSKDCL